jgi:sugar phosphate isomerase/epimerase
VGKIKIGCAAFSFTNPLSAYAPPYEAAIDAVGAAGLDTTELILHQESDLDSYWTPSRIREIRAQLRRNKLELSEFVLYHDAVPGLPSLDSNTREKSLEAFEKGVVLAEKLGSPLINMVAHWPEGLEAIANYPPTYIYPGGRGATLFSPELRYTLPQPFDWDSIWDTYVNTLRECTSIAKRHGLGVALEGHPNVIVSYVDSFLRLFDAIDDNALGMNYDTGMQMIMREYVPWSIYKLKDRLVHMHVRDTDGLLAYNLPVGKGILPWDEIVRATVDVGYEGVMSLELGGYQDPMPYVIASAGVLRNLIDEYGG